MRLHFLLQNLIEICPLLPEYLVWWIEAVWSDGFQLAALTSVRFPAATGTQFHAPVVSPPFTCLF